MEQEGKTVEEFIRDDPHFKVGTRVKIVGNPVAMRIYFKKGTIVGEGDYAGYYLVDLDKRGRYFHADGRMEYVKSIIEAYDNMKVSPE
jgi:hypothetical protein